MGVPEEVVHINQKESPTEMRSRITLPGLTFLVLCTIIGLAITVVEVVELMLDSGVAPIVAIAALLIIHFWSR